MNLRDFAQQYGISAIVRRHFGYRKPIGDVLVHGRSVLGSLIYGRIIDPAKLGLTFEEVQKAYEQGQMLVEMNILPSAIIAGIDQRNIEGGLATAEALKKFGSVEIPVWTSPAVTYPHYINLERAAELFANCGDYAVHRYLSGKTGEKIWSEPASVFESRIIAAVLANYDVGEPILFDLNFEQVTLLYFRHVKSLRREEIPDSEGAWVPKMGGGVVYSADCKIAMEFQPDLTLAEIPTN